MGVSMAIDHDLRLKMEEVGRKISDRIADDLPTGIGFSFFMFQFGEGGWLSYISNVQREDVVKALEEWLDRNRRGEQEILGKGH